MADESDFYKMFEKRYPMYAGKRMRPDNGFVHYSHSPEHTNTCYLLGPGERCYHVGHAMAEDVEPQGECSDIGTSERDEKGVVVVDNLNHAEDSTETGAASSVCTNNEAKGGSGLSNELGLLSLEASGQSSSAPHITPATASGRNDETGAGYALNIDFEMSNEEAAAYS